MTEIPARLPSAVLRRLHMSVGFAAVQQHLAAWQCSATGVCTVQCQWGLCNALELTPPGSLKSNSHKGQRGGNVDAALKAGDIIAARPLHQGQGVTRGR